MACVPHRHELSYTMLCAAMREASFYEPAHYAQGKYRSLEHLLPTYPILAMTRLWSEAEVLVSCSQAVASILAEAVLAHRRSIFA